MSPPSPQPSTYASPVDPALFSDPVVNIAAGKCVAQGAEARVYEGTFLGRPAIFKQRFPKLYRHPALNARLTAARVKAEARALARARRLGVPTPAVLFVDARASTLYLEAVAGGVTLRDVLRATSPPASPARVAALMDRVGAVVAALHDGGMVHGDLTTSNLLVRRRGGGGDAGGSTAESAEEIVVIDFGLATNTVAPEDRAVDLFVLERALTAAHSAAEGSGGSGAAGASGGGGGNGASTAPPPPPAHGPAAHCPDALFAAVLAAYRRHCSGWRPTLSKFAEVRLRGRKRSMVG